MTRDPGLDDGRLKRPRVITCNVVTVDGRLTLAPGVSLFAGDPRWTALMTGIGDPYAWPRELHDPDVLLEGSGSFLAPASAELLPVTPTRTGPRRSRHSSPRPCARFPVATGSPSSTVVDGSTCRSPSGRTRHGPAGTRWC